MLGIGRAATLPLEGFPANQAATVFGILLNAAFVCTDFNLVVSLAKKCFQILSPQLIMFRVATGTSWSSRAETSAALSVPEFTRTLGSRSEEGSEGHY